MTSYDHDETFGLYMAILKKGESSPLLPESDEDGGVGSAPASTEDGATPGGRGGRGGGRGGAASGPVTVTIDFDGLAQRILAVPGIPERQYSQLKAGVAGTVFYLEAGGRGGDNPAATLQRFRISDRRADGRKLVYRAAGGGGGGRGRGAAPAEGAAAGPSLFLVDADRVAPTPGSGRLNASLRMYLDPKEEFKQIFYEGWRNQRDYLYVPNTHGADWAKMKELYGQMLPSVMHRADLNYLLDTMGAEIAIGHSFVRGGDMPAVPASRAGLLGADFVVENGRYKIARIYDTESWNPELRAPLATPGATAAVGEYIVAINGQELRAPDSIYRLLDGTSGRQTVLTLNMRPSMEGSRNITVVPIPNEQGLRTRAWVEANRRTVDKLSGGKLAYVYIPSTGQPGYASFNRYYFAQQDKLGAVIDERFNSGGSAADYIIDVLQRKFDGYFNNVAGDRVPFTSPEAGIWGPKVMIVNEMAGSGGDLMPWMFKHRNVGLLVGKRTWGGLVHTADTPPFIDGGSMIAPRGGFFTADGKWDVENVGTAPDIDVENWPKDVIAGHDPQLERAVTEALRMLAEKPVTRMMKEPASPTWGERKAPFTAPVTGGAQQP
jgi:tricorn protease